MKCVGKRVSERARTKWHAWPMDIFFSKCLFCICHERGIWMSQWVRKRVQIENEITKNAWFLVIKSSGDRTNVYDLQTKCILTKLQRMFSPFLILVLIKKSYITKRLCAQIVFSSKAQSNSVFELKKHKLIEEANDRGHLWAPSSHRDWVLLLTSSAFSINNKQMSVCRPR